MLRTAFFLALSTAALAGGAAACSSSSTASPAASDAGGGADLDAGDASADATADASPATVNGCTEADFAANDRTAPGADRTLQGPATPTPAQFSPHCMRVKATQTVTWTGDFDSHPLTFKLVSTTDGGFVNDAATEVVIGPDGGTSPITVTPNERMTIAFTCTAHPTVMFGAVDAVP
jgi:plastocyanin